MADDPPSQSGTDVLEDVAEEHQAGEASNTTPVCTESANGRMSREDPISLVDIEPTERILSRFVLLEDCRVGAIAERQLDLENGPSLLHSHRITRSSRSVSP